MNLSRRKYANSLEEKLNDYWVIIQKLIFPLSQYNERFSDVKKDDFIYLISDTNYKNSISILNVKRPNYV